MLSEEILIERIARVNPAPDHVDTGLSATILLAAIDERSGLMQTQKPERQTQGDSGSKIPRGLLVAVAAFAVVILGGVLFLASQPDGDVATDPTTTTVAPTTTIEAQDLGDPRLAAAIAGATDFAADGRNRYEATIEPWEPQLVFETGGPDCQPDTDVVQFNELDALTAEHSMVRLTKGESTGTVEVLRFADPAVAEQAAPILEQLLRSERECITSSLTGELGSAFKNFNHETVPFAEQLGVFMVTYEHDDGTGRVAYVQVAAGIEDDLLYIITFRSNEAPVDNGFLDDLYFVTTDMSQ